MGNQVTQTANILVQDQEFDSLISKHLFKKLFADKSLSEYQFGGSEKFLGDSVRAQQTLIKCLGFGDFNPPRIILNKDGSIKTPRQEYSEFTRLVKNYLDKFLIFNGFDIKLVLTCECAQFIWTLCNLLNPGDSTEDRLTPSDIEIILVNNKRNGKHLHVALIELSRICKINNIDLVIKEFTAYSSMGKGVKRWVDLANEKNYTSCSTTETFPDNIRKILCCDNTYAKEIVQYSVELNKTISTKIVPKICEAVGILTNIYPDIANVYGMENLQVCVEYYIGKLIYGDADKLQLDELICDRLSKDLSKVVDCIEEELKRVTKESNDGKITKLVACDRKKILHRLKCWFKIHVTLTKSHLLQFPTHAVAATLIKTGNETLRPVDAWAVRSGDFMDIVKTKPPNSVQSFPVVHYVSDDPEQTRTVIEELVLGVINTPDGLHIKDDEPKLKIGYYIGS
jgi:hypothetical protein